MDYLGKGEVLTNTDLDRFVNNINKLIISGSFVHRKCFRSLSSAHEKGSKYKSVAFIPEKSQLFSVLAPQCWNEIPTTVRTA